ncbi:MAG: DUF3604 domain-containing protein [Caldilineaceae bacterium]
MTASGPRGYDDLALFYGDLHNHCNLSYGHGSLEDALHNARLQLDFASVTVHAVWPDLPQDDPYLDYLVDYHREGFVKAQTGWPGYVQAIEAANEDGTFVTFPSFEWHSMRYGDHCVYYKHGQRDERPFPIIEAPDLPALRQSVRDLQTDAFVIPHHIGYRAGSRGIDWGAFSEELSPVAEIFSFHGLAESSEGPYPYLHSMGPRHSGSTAQHGWAQGHVVGLIGSTDHHNSFPGSYGYGRLAVWASSLSRDDIWDAIANRRTYALTGDRIDVAFAVNEQPLGSVLGPAAERWIDVSVRGGSSIDYIEVLHNNQIIHREDCYPQRIERGLFKVFVEVGWGERSQETAWDVTLRVKSGRLRQAEPRFRGRGPTDAPAEDAVFAYTNWVQDAAYSIHFETRTRQNPSLHTAATEGMALEIEGDAQTVLIADVNGQRMEIPLTELIKGSQTANLGGFVSPAICFHRAIPETEYNRRFAFAHRGDGAYRNDRAQRLVLRPPMRQRNDQWAWTSPIWVEPPSR